MHIPKDEVHIFTASLSASLAEEQALLTLLSDDERERADRFIAPKHRHRFIIAHGILRQLLSVYLDQQAASIKFAYSQYQKPMLADLDTHCLQFNLSHSEDFVVYAFAQQSEIGIDIEIIRDELKMDIAERFFSPAEIIALKALPLNEQTTGFYRLWSRKEAVIKANGKGLSQPLSSFSVAAIDIPETLTLEDKNWSIYPLSIHPEFAGALATAQPISHLLIWDVINGQPVARDA
jgi:4'-phosphopantetheinyl transferase